MMIGWPGQGQLMLFRLPFSQILWSIQQASCQRLVQLHGSPRKHFSPISHRLQEKSRAHRLSQEAFRLELEHQCPCRGIGYSWCQRYPKLKRGISKNDRASPIYLTCGWITSTEAFTHDSKKYLGEPKRFQQFSVQFYDWLDHHCHPGVCKEPSPSYKILQIDCEQFVRQFDFHFYFDTNR